MEITRGQERTVGRMIRKEEFETNSSMTLACLYFQKRYSDVKSNNSTYLGKHLQQMFKSSFLKNITAALSVSLSFEKPFI